MTGGHVNTGEKTRGRIAAGALLVFVLLAMAMASASAACPNEAFRTGPSAQLAECRAYEMVTPVDKEGGVGFDERSSAAQASASGDGIYFNSSSAYGPPQGNLLRSPYVSTRVGDTWDTQAIGGPQANYFAFAFSGTFAVSDDLGLAFNVSKEALAPGAVAGGSNLYIRDNRTGTYTTVAGLPGNDGIGAWNNTVQTSPFVDAATDWSNILVASEVSLTPDAVEGVPNLYELSGGSLRLAVAEATPASRSAATPNVMSTDGRRFYFFKEGILYLHQTGGETLRVSEDEDGEPVPNASFLGATQDGETAFFVREASRVYRFEASAPAGNRVTALVPPLGLEGNVTQVVKAYAGEDGTTVYFAATNLLTPDAEVRDRSLAEPGGNGYDLYVWHGEPGEPGGLRYIGKSEKPFETLGPRTTVVSPNGRYFGFESSGMVTSDAVDGSAAACPSYLAEEPAGRCPNVFLYSYDTDRVVCVSCDGSPPVGRSQIGGAPARAVTFANVSQAVIDDGTIFFDTPNALSPRDANGLLDAYSWHDGVTQLISSGISGAPSTFVDASDDASDVFFQTQQPLVGQDIDESADIYDARVDGGLPQEGPETSRPCSSESSCRPSSSAPGAPVRTGTTGVGGAREGTGTCSALQRRARTARKRSRTLAHRARAADGRTARALRRKAAREARTARGLGRRAHDCTGGGR